MAADGTEASVIACRPTAAHGSVAMTGGLEAQKQEELWTEYGQIDSMEGRIENLWRILRS